MQLCTTPVGCQLGTQEVLVASLQGTWQLGSHVSLAPKQYLLQSPSKCQDGAGFKQLMGQINHGPCLGGNVCDTSGLIILRFQGQVCSFQNLETLGTQVVLVAKPCGTQRRGPIKIPDSTTTASRHDLTRLCAFTCTGPP